jgi:hypothetical protein
MFHIDTRGLYSVQGDSEGDAAGLMLLEMALSKAETIRLVLVDEYQTIAGGAAKYRFLGRVLGQLILDPQNASILFVYNRFFCHEGASCPQVEPNRTVFIIERIKGYAQRLRAAILQEIAKIANETKTHVGGKDPDAGSDPSPPDTDRRLDNFGRSRYTEILESNFAAGRLAYFDPTSEDSIAGLQQKIADLEPIRPDQFDFFATNEVRRVFDQDLADLIAPLDALLLAHLDSLRFPDSILDVCNTTIHRRGQNLTEQVEELRREYKSIEETPVVVFTCQWDLRRGWSLVHKHTCTYTRGIPYFKIKENLSDGTTRLETTITDTAFDVTYTSPNAKQIAREWGQTVLDSIENATAGSENVVWTTVTGAFGFVTGAAKGFMNSIVRSRPCAGRVQLLAHAVDLPATNALLQKIKDQLAEVQDNLKRVLKHKQSNVKVKINDALDLDRKRVQTLADAKEFREMAAREYLANEQEIQKYGNLVVRLPSHGNAIFDEFRGHLEKCKAVEAFSLDSNDETKVNEVVDAIGNAVRDRRAEFKAYRFLDRPLRMDSDRKRLLPFMPFRDPNWCDRKSMVW